MILIDVHTLMMSTLLTLQQLITDYGILQYKLNNTYCSMTAIHTHHHDHNHKLDKTIMNNLLVQTLILMPSSIRVQG
jgi:hypothetical protein